MNNYFGKALIISTAAHSLIFLPFFNSPITTMLRENKPMVVDYVKIKEPPRVEILKRRSEQAASAPKITIAKTVETPKIELAKVVDVKPANLEVKPAKNSTQANRAAMERAAKKQAKIRSTKDYVNYYQLIREKIRQRLKANYSYYRKEGDIHLIFNLNSEGELLDASIDQATSASNSTLREIALSSLKEASPFPSFPKALSLPRMTFEVIISFRKD